MVNQAKMNEALEVIEPFCLDNGIDVGIKRKWEFELMKADEESVYIYPVSSKARIRGIKKHYTDLSAALREVFIGSKKKEMDPLECDCGGRMVMRTNSKNGNKFYGCNRYPRCMNTKQL